MAGFVLAAVHKMLGRRYVLLSGWQFDQLRPQIKAQLLLTDRAAYRSCLCHFTFDGVAALVILGGSDNLKSAKVAILVLLQLSAGKQMDIKPYLTSERQRKLIENYRMLLK